MNDAIQRTINDLDLRTRDLCEKGEVNAYLARYGLQLALAHESQHYVSIRLPWQTRRKVYFVKKLSREP